MTNPSFHTAGHASRVNSVLVSVFSTAVVVLVGFLSLASFAGA